jgi:ABC-2 type transport system permease protein
MILPALTLWQREMVRFFRQRDRVIGAFATPIVFWLLLGLGLGKSFKAPLAPEGHGYLEYFYAGTLVMILLFTAIFSTFSLIEDRKEGFLQAVLVAPVGRWGLVLGKILGGTTLALIQAVVFLAFAPFLGMPLSVASVLWLLGVMFLVAFALTGLGFTIAWWMNSTAGYHAIMNVFLIPLWLLSGAVFPASGAPVWFRWVMNANPLTYGVTAIRAGLYWNVPHEDPTVGLIVTSVFAVVMLGVSLYVARQTTESDLL